MADDGKVDEVGSVRVVCRFRPLNSMETEKGAKLCVEFPPTSDGVPRAVKYKGQKQSANRMSVAGDEERHDSKEKDLYYFDNVFDTSAEQATIFNSVGKQIVEDVLHGYNGTIFAYGQTGSGKTHTMEGNLQSESGRGMIPRMVACIFDSIMEAEEDIEFTVKVSYMEIYMERIKDLLDVTKENLQIHEDKQRGIWVGNATETYVMSEDEVLDLLHQGHRNRQVASTNMNAESSRSHSIFVITVGQRNIVDMSVKTGKLYLVDLAGSEKVSKTGAEGQQLEEAKNINKSLSALGNVIYALTDGKSTHIPYRDSKLTRILQESIGGNSRTALIICCSPAQYNDQETLSTIRFGTRAKKVRNKPKINQERSLQELKMLLAKAEAEIERLQTRVDELEDQLEQGGGGGAAGVTPGGQSRFAALQERYRALEGEKEEVEQKKDELIEELEALKHELEVAGQTAGPGAYSDEYQEEVEELMSEKAGLQQEVTELKLKYEKADYECREKALTIESLTQANKILIQELGEMRDGGGGAEGGSSITKLLSGWQSDDNKIQARHAELLADLQSAMTTGGSGGSPTGGHQQKASSDLQNETVTALKTRIEELERVKKNLSAEVVELRTKSTELEAIVSANEKTRAAHEEAVEGEEVNVEVVKRENEDLKWELEKLRANKENLDNYIAEREAVFQQQEEDWRLHKDKLEEDFRALRDQLRSKLSEFDQLKQALYKDLRNRCDKVVNLEKSLHDTKEQYDELLAQTDHKELYKKILFLERRNEHLTLIYTKAVNEGRALKATRQGELDHHESQIKLRDERIKSLEFMLSTLKDQNERLTAIAASSGIDVTKDGHLSSRSMSGTFSAHNLNAQARQQHQQHQQQQHALSGGGSGEVGDSPKPSGPMPVHGHAVPGSRIARPIRGGHRPDARGMKDKEGKKSMFGMALSFFGFSPPPGQPGHDPSMPSGTLSKDGTSVIPHEIPPVPSVEGAHNVEPTDSGGPTPSSSAAASPARPGAGGPRPSTAE